jgi:hypothetical protein
MGGPFARGILASGCRLDGLSRRPKAFGRFAGLIPLGCTIQTKGALPQGSAWSTAAPLEAKRLGQDGAQARRRRSLVQIVAVRPSTMVGAAA